jgi:hypothetical protein
MIAWQQSRRSDSILGKQLPMSLASYVHEYWKPLALMASYYRAARECLKLA